MGYWVDVQVKFAWDTSNSPREGGSVAGKAVANILQQLHTYCYDFDSTERVSEIREWFAGIEKHYPGKLCDFGDFLKLDQNYSNKGDDDPSLKGMFHTTWVQTEVLVRHLYVLRDSILSARPESKWWYESSSTDGDIVSLIHSLNLIHSLGGNMVRLYIA